MRRHRTKRLIGAGVAGLMVLVLVAAIVLESRRDGSLDDAVTASGPGSSTVTSDAEVISTVVTDSVEAPATTPSPPTTVATVTIDPAAYIGRDHRDVVDELRALGFVVEERRVSSDGAKKNTVVAVEPSGPLAPGAAVEVQVAKPGKAGG
ncbi:MAG: PASTA domain-containing protein [Actinobacteria bacterium]|nr:PASTA domain-containing protein [Actinomycetota bacterium]